MESVEVLLASVLVDDLAPLMRPPWSMVLVLTRGDGRAVEPHVSWSAEFHGWLANVQPEEDGSGWSWRVHDRDGTARTARAAVTAAKKAAKAVEAEWVAREGPNDASDP